MENGLCGSNPQGIYKYYEKNPESADEKVFGRVSYPDRRGFLKGAGLATMAAVLGGAIPFHRNMPAGIIPAAFAEGLDEVMIEGKDAKLIKTGCKSLVDILKKEVGA